MRTRMLTFKATITDPLKTPNSIAVYKKYPFYPCLYQLNSFGDYNGNRSVGTYITSCCCKWNRTRFVTEESLHRKTNMLDDVIYWKCQYHFNVQMSE